MLLCTTVTAMLLSACGGGSPDEPTAEVQAATTVLHESLTDLDNAAPDPIDVGDGQAETAGDHSFETSTTVDVPAGKQIAALGINPPTDKVVLSVPESGGEATLGTSASPLPLIWHSEFQQGLDDWPNRSTGWGQENRSFAPAVGIQGQALSVWIPKGSIDPGTMKVRGLPFGGTGFKSTLPGAGYDLARLTYKVRFPADFEQGMGGKLPGLCGGTCNAGGKMPDGTDGFSVRYMWTGNFRASVYAYLPSSQTYGTGFGVRQIPLKRGEWVELSQEVKLNTPGLADGHIRVWADGQLVVDAQGIVFRTTASLKINRVFFDVFYGGNTDAWAAPKDTAIGFAEFQAWGR